MEIIMSEDHIKQNNILNPPTARTLSEHIADQIREAILTEVFIPNQRLTEEDIANSMETSRGPVRDALRILEGEGLIIRKSHRGAHVAELLFKDVEEIYTLREALEILAIKCAILNATSVDINKLNKLINRFEILSKKEYTQFEAVDLDMEFHRTLCQISGHERLLNAWEALSSQIRLLLLKHRLWDPDDLRDRAVESHLQIVDAIKKKDTNLAIKRLQEHMSLSTRWLREAIEKESSKDKVSD
jgi:DNA-binding GntR family transcriptional regulator